MSWEYRNIQFQTVPRWGLWSKLSRRDLEHLESLQHDGWEVFHSVNVRGSFGFTAHVVFLLRRERP
jgi:hypothetical protein